jgi:hypothetical protein
MGSLRYCQAVRVFGIGKVHRIPPVELNCVSEKRRREMTARQLTGWGGSKAVAAPAQNRPLRLFAEKA